MSGSSSSSSLHKKWEHYSLQLAPELLAAPSLLKKICFHLEAMQEMTVSTNTSASSEKTEEAGEGAMEAGEKEEEDWIDVNDEELSPSSPPSSGEPMEEEGEELDGQRQQKVEEHKERKKRRKVSPYPSTTELLQELLQVFYPEPEEKEGRKKTTEEREGETLAEGEETKEERDAFVEAMLSQLPEPTKRQRTENGAYGFSSSDNPLLDFFFQVFGCTTNRKVKSLLSASWQAMKQETLQAVAHLRDVREGKGERGVAYFALRWLYQHHPRTLIFNLPAIVKLGYWKDLNTLLLLLATLEDKTPWERHKAIVDKDCPRANRKLMAFRMGKRDNDQRIQQYGLKRLANAQRKKAIKKRKREEKTSQARGIFNTNKDYRALHTAVALVYASQLQRDKLALKRSEGEKAKKREVSSLAAKWAPSPGKSEDEHTLLSSTIALLLYPEASFRHQQANKAEPFPVYLDRARRLYAKNFLTPLRGAARLTETLMSAGKWEEIDYARVPSVCMKNRKQAFQKRDAERFSQYLVSVAQGEKKINSKALMPHEILGPEPTQFDEVKELQWKEYVEQMKRKCTLSHSLAVVDVSGSMRGLPLEVAIALGLLIAECSLPPFQGLVCTFSAKPRFFKVELSQTLPEKYNAMLGMDWGYNTDIQAVYQLILRQAKAAQLKKEEMVQQIFIFSDMEFDKQKPNKNKATVFEKMKAEFSAAGYDLPRLIFWNLRPGERGHHQKAAVTCPVTQHESGTALVSGFSANLLSLFADGKLEAMSPVTVLEKALERYKDMVKVVD